MEIDELKEWLKERISALDGPLVQNGDLVRAKTYAEVLSKIEETAPGRSAMSAPEQRTVTGMMWLRTTLTGRIEVLFEREGHWWLAIEAT